MNCINACHDPRNPNSGRVMRSCGMTLEGTWRAGGINNQGVCDETWYSILRSEYGKASKPPVAIRQERKEDQHAVEALTRRAFWNMYSRAAPSIMWPIFCGAMRIFIPELDLVAETADGRIVGNVMYTKARLTDENGKEAVILTFGPISVHPDFQRKGISKLLLEYSFEEARGSATRPWSSLAIRTIMSPEVSKAAADTMCAQGTEAIRPPCLFWSFFPAFWTEENGFIRKAPPTRSTPQMWNPLTGSLNP